MNPKLLNNTLTALRDTCKNRADICRKEVPFLSRNLLTDTAQLYKGKAQAYDDIAELITRILSGC
mgnify:CR=1 FL=1